MADNEIIADAFSIIPDEAVKRYREFFERTNRTGSFEEFAVYSHLEQIKIQKSLTDVIENCFK